MAGVLLGVLMWCAMLKGCLAVSVDMERVETEEWSSVTLSCVVKTSPTNQPIITWRKGSPASGSVVLNVNTAGLVNISPNYTGRVRRKGQANLEMISPELSDSGNYSCEAVVATDISPMAVGYVFLQVKRKPSDTVSLMLAVVNTLASICGTGLLTILAVKKWKIPSVSQYILNLSWTFSCLVGASILWIGYKYLRTDANKDAVRRVGIAFSVIGLVLLLFLPTIMGIKWIARKCELTIRKDDTFEN